MAVTFEHCGGSASSYLALFPNYREVAPSKHNFNVAPGEFYDALLSATKSVPSGRVLPDEYFMFFESQWGGCGTFVQSDHRPGLKGVIAASIGFR